MSGLFEANGLDVQIGWWVIDVIIVIMVAWCYIESNVATVFSIEFNIYSLCYNLPIVWGTFVYMWFLCSSACCMIYGFLFSFLACVFCLVYEKETKKRSWFWPLTQILYNFLKLLFFFKQVIEQFEVGFSNSSNFKMCESNRNRLKDIELKFAFWF